MMLELAQGPKMPPDLRYLTRVAYLRDLAWRAGHRELTWPDYFDRMAVYVAIAAGVGFILGYLSGVSRL
jgi:hypothetical protein